MPCRDYDDSDIISNQSEEIKKLRSLLCEACGIIRDNELTKYASTQLHTWALSHQREDRERQRKEAEKIRLENIAAATIRSLSPEQLESLRLMGLSLKNKA